MLEHDRYIELRLRGVVRGVDFPGESSYRRAVECGRLLLDATDVERIEADVLWLASFVRSVQALGSFRTAVVAPSPLVFGTFRQVLAYRGDLPHPAPVEFFQSREPALSWLLRGTESAAG
ncbi:MAG: hypothetical protein KatS3mg062_0902 [Tepidiforma sp.]|nr:MAG: hypothetical protein KatS3mg062_0902 [Tepidiforma sp.]